mmetsp:Transcript_63423/g.183774  ORF Transcript_63423/g.183774 Transcript_63423/m.183774 type:complete len:201 (+) Transcript_63423:478-1080(+)
MAARKVYPAASSPRRAAKRPGRTPHAGGEPILPHASAHPLLRRIVARADAPFASRSSAAAQPHGCDRRQLRRPRGALRGGDAQASGRLGAFCMRHVLRRLRARQPACRLSWMCRAFACELRCSGFRGADGRACASLRHSRHATSVAPTHERSVSLMQRGMELASLGRPRMALVRRRGLSTPRRWDRSRRLYAAFARLCAC